MNTTLKTVLTATAAGAFLGQVGLVAIGAGRTLERLTAMHYTETDSISNLAISTAKTFGYGITIAGIAATLATGIVGYRLLHNGEGNHDY
ncbi:MAG TPA: hypothetical protein VJB87_01230 [Candidatus Nanoarchaeia archaeon]|nr:hypothetical protein [Candidatus Nanoarchaeia archaeon]